MQPVVTVVGRFEQIALHLKPQVASVAGMFPYAVVHACQHRRSLGVCPETYIPRIHGILEGEAALELAELYFDERVFFPFRPSVQYARPFLRTASGYAVHFHLKPVSEIPYFAVDVCPDEADVEGGMRFVFIVQILVVECSLTDDVAAECRVLLDILPPFAFIFLGMACPCHPGTGYKKKYLFHRTFYFPAAKLTQKYL